MSGDLNDHGQLGRFLAGKGWKITPTSMSSGTAACRAWTKEILIKPWAYRQLHKAGRIRDYVLEHEMAHAAHAQLLNYHLYDLDKWRRLEPLAAIEVVADAWCLHRRNDKTMRRWVQASVLWHGRIGSRYSMGDVQSQQAARVVQAIKAELELWAGDDATAR